MNSNDIIQKIQDAYDFAQEVMPRYPLWVKYSRGNFVALLDISEFSRDDCIAERLSKYGYDDILFSYDELQASGLSLDDIRNYSFGAIPIEVS